MATTLPPGVVLGAAGTSTRCGEMRLGHGEGGPVQGPAFPVALGPHRREVAGAGRHLGQRGRQADVAGHDAREPAGLLFGRAEVRQRKGAEDGRGPQRDRRHGATLLLEHEAQLGQPQTRATVCLGHSQAEEVGPGELRPQGRVEAVVGLLDLRHALDERHALEDRRRGLRHRQLLLGEVEVHQAAPASASAGRNIGMVSSGSTATISATTGIPMRTSAGSMPITSPTRRVPSSSSTTAMGNG